MLLKNLFLSTFEKGFNAGMEYEPAIVGETIGSSSDIDEYSHYNSIIGELAKALSQPFYLHIVTDNTRGTQEMAITNDEKYPDTFTTDESAIGGYYEYSCVKISK